MGEREVRERLERALRQLLEGDLYLLENDLSERCIAARLAMYLREEFEQHDVDVESLLSHIFSATAASEGLGNPVARAS